MVIQNVTVNDCTPETIVIGRRGTFETMQVVFDLTYLIENYGDGTAVLALKRSQDSSAYPAIAAQDGNTLTWVVSEVDTYYVGAGVCQLMWYVDEGLAKTVIYPMVVMKDILSTSEEPPDGYENWIEHLTELGAETQQHALDAAQSATEAETAQGKAEDAQEAAEVAAGRAETAIVHAPVIYGGYWFIWDNGQYVNTNIRAEGQKGDKGDKGDKLTYADLTEADKLDLIQGPIADAQEAAEQAVEDKGQEVIDSLPQDYMQLEDHFESLEDNIVLVQDTQPSSADNRIWVDPDDNEIEIPTMDEFEGLKNAINAVANIPELVWDHSFINEAGNVSLSNYTVLSKKYPCRPGDMIVNNSPSRDDNNIPFVSFLAVYDENGFVERLVNTSSKTRTQILDDGITAFRILFGRSSTTEVQWQDSDFQYLNYAFYLKPESYKDAIDFETEINDRIDSLLIANGESWEG